MGCLSIKLSNVRFVIEAGYMSLHTPESWPCLPQDEWFLQPAHCDPHAPFKAIKSIDKWSKTKNKRVKHWFCHLHHPWGVLDLSLGWGVPPGPWNPDPVYDQKFVKFSKNWYPVYDFQVKFHSFFLQNVWFLDPVYKKSSKIFEFETLFMSGQSKNHTLKGGTSPYSLRYVWEYPLGLHPIIFFKYSRYLI